MQFKLLVASASHARGLALCSKILQAAGGSHVIDTIDAIDMDRLVGRAAAIRPDVVLAELVPGLEESQSAALARLRRLVETRILLLCDACTPPMIIRFVQRGASGCLPRSTAPALMLKALTGVHQGEDWFGRAALLQALRSQIGTAPLASLQAPDRQLLTVREQEVLDLIGAALSNKEIARHLRISEQTVKTHLHHIYVKLHKSGRYKAFLADTWRPPA